MIVDGFKKNIQIKIGICGPGMSGKTTFIKNVLSQFGKEVYSGESSIKRTLICDYGTLTVPLNEWKMKIHVFSTAGAKYYEVTRPIILSGCDGIIFIIDSHKNVLDRNVASWKELTDYFKTTLETMPKIFVFNKQDLSEKFNPSIFLKKIKFKNLHNVDIVNATAISGKGTYEAFEKVIDLIVKNMNIFEFISAMTHS